MRQKLLEVNDEDGPEAALQAPTKNPLPIPQPSHNLYEKLGAFPADEGGQNREHY